MLHIMLRQSYTPQVRKSCHILTQVTAILCLLVVGCAQSEKKEQVEVVTETSWKSELHTDTIFDSLTSDQLQYFQPDVRLAAFWNGRSVQVYVRNTTDQLIKVEPMNFGVIVDGKNYPARPGVAIPSFPLTTLSKQEMATGLFEFPKLGNLEGRYLYFRHPQVRASRVIIKSQPKKKIHAEDSSAP